MLLFLDLETTGLVPGSILEMAAVITDDKLNVVTLLHRVIHYKGSTAHLDPAVVAMHEHNGLWWECEHSSYELAFAEADLLTWITIHCDVPPQLAGNTINFDRMYIDACMPKVSKALHYRNVDLTTLNEMARRFWPYAYEKRPLPTKTHRAVADVTESLALAHHYARALQSVDLLGVL